MAGKGPITLSHDGLGQERLSTARQNQVSSDRNALVQTLLKVNEDALIKLKAFRVDLIRRLETFHPTGPEKHGPVMSIDYRSMLACLETERKPPEMLIKQLAIRTTTPDDFQLIERIKPHQVLQTSKSRRRDTDQRQSQQETPFSIVQNNSESIEGSKSSKNVGVTNRRQRAQSRKIRQTDFGPQTMSNLFPSKEQEEESFEQEVPERSSLANDCVKDQVKVVEEQKANMVMNTFFIDFLALANSSRPAITGIEAFRKWLQKQQPSRPLPFTGNQIKLLIEKHKRYGDNWEKICSFFDGRRFDQLYYLFQNDRTHSDFLRGRWTLWQSVALVVLIEYFGAGKWAQISRKLRVKSQIQVRQRYCNILDPNITRNSWTSEQAAELLRQAPLHSYQWAKLASLPLFGHKTDNALWRKFRNIFQKYPQARIREQIRNKPQLADKIIEYKRQKIRERMDPPVKKKDQDLKVPHNGYAAQDSSENEDR